MSLEHRAQSVEQKMRPQNFVKIAGGAGNRRLTEEVFEKIGNINRHCETASYMSFRAHKLCVATWQSTPFCKGGCLRSRQGDFNNPLISLLLSLTSKVFPLTITVAGGIA